MQDGGFANHKKGVYRPDATAWAIIVFSILNSFPDTDHNTIMSPALKNLAQNQMPDGRVVLSVDQPQTCWPTPLAIIAWHKKEQFINRQNKAVHFMLEFTGRHGRNTNPAIGHDTLIKGWPWIEDTHSWVEPTSMAIIALEIAGRKKHPRIEEAVKMLMNRQLTSGGWNYGNTRVFDQQLRPMLESTGIALSALHKKVEKASIDKSLKYLQDNIDQLKTPLSLSWGLLGLSTWGIIPADKQGLIARCLEQQEIFGTYNTVQLSLLLVAMIAKKGLVDLIK